MQKFEGLFTGCMPKMKENVATKAFHNGGFLARYHRQNADVAPYLMMKESNVVS
jgi:hypothetical protein